MMADSIRSVPEFLCQECQFESCSEWCSNCQQTLYQDCLKKHSDCLSQPLATDLSFHSLDLPQQSVLSELSELKVLSPLSPVQCLVPNYQEIKLVAEYRRQNLEDSGLNTTSFITECPTTGQIIVSDCNNHQVVILSNNFQLVTAIGSHGNRDGQFEWPHGVAVNKQEHIFIADSNTNRIQVLDKQGDVIRKVGTRGWERQQFTCPIGLTFDDNKSNLYISDYGNYRIQVLQEDGTYVREWGYKGKGNGQFRSWPRSIAVTPAGRAVVADEDGNLYIFTTEGNHIRTISKDYPPQNIIARCVATDHHNNIIITDQRGYIVVMSEDAEVICTFGQQEDGSEELKDPLGVCVTANGNILVCDEGNCCIQLFEVPKETAI